MIALSSQISFAACSRPHGGSVLQPSDSPLLVAENVAQFQCRRTAKDRQTMNPTHGAPMSSLRVGHAYSLLVMLMRSNGRTM